MDVKRALEGAGMEAFGYGRLSIRKWTGRNEERVSYPETGDPYEAARVKLAAAITHELRRKKGRPAVAYFP